MQHGRCVYYRWLLPGTAVTLLLFRRVESARSRAAYVQMDWCMLGAGGRDDATAACSDLRGTACQHTCPPTAIASAQNQYKDLYANTLLPIAFLVWGKPCWFASKQPTITRTDRSLGASALGSPSWHYGPATGLVSNS